MDYHKEELSLSGNKTKNIYTSTKITGVMQNQNTVPQNAVTVAAALSSRLLNPLYSLLHPFDGIVTHYLGPGHYLIATESEMLKCLPSTFGYLDALAYICEWAPTPEQLGWNIPHSGIHMMINI